VKAPRRRPSHDFAASSSATRGVEECGGVRRAGVRDERVQLLLRLHIAHVLQVCSRNR